jgi:hypothetical protein
MIARPGGEVSAMPPQPQSEARPRAFLRMLPFLCAVAILWLATRHYFGVVQDARFYMLEALRNLDPAAYADDMYFKFGSQGSFSLFTRLYQPFVSHFGIGASGMGFTILGQLFWIVALICLARSWVSERYMWLAVAAAIAMPNGYAFFAYGEDFATPRLFAEALTMLALALLRARPVWSVILLVCAAALHPLMALPGMVAVFVYFALGRPLLWAAIPAGVIAALMLGWANIQPFANMLQTIDPGWFAVIKLRSAQCLVLTWSRATYFQILFVFVWTSIALFLASAQDRRFLIAVLAAGAAGLLCALVGGDLARNVFIVELQPWRSVWLLQIVSRIYTPVIFGTLFARSALVAERKADPFAVTVLFTIVLILVSGASRLIQMPYAAEFTSHSLVFVTLAVAVIFVQLVLRDQKHRRLRQASVCFALILIPIAALDWDQRLPWTKFLESPAPPPSDLTALIPANASVYWEGGAEMPWLKLRRSDYFSCEQGTGVVFHRETAMTYKHRLESFWPLRRVDLERRADCRGLDLGQKANRTPAGLRDVCRREPELDYLALMAPITGAPSRIWKSPAPFQDVHLVDQKISAYVTDRFYIYSCAGLR